ncbi:MAG TPA: hypothetical protein VJ747_09075 [Stellaceae bacterium]|nr:hypothetical protein [Stellaceae bacterium]
MPSLWNDPEHWRSRAEEARATADQMHDLDSKRVMLGIAEGYDELAARAEARKSFAPADRAARRHL